MDKLKALAAEVWALLLHLSSTLRPVLMIAAVLLTLQLVLAHFGVRLPYVPAGDFQRTAMLAALCAWVAR